MGMDLVSYIIDSSFSVWKYGGIVWSLKKSCEYPLKVQNTIFLIFLISKYRDNEIFF